MMCPTVPTQIEVDGWRGTRENREDEIAEVTLSCRTLLGDTVLFTMLSTLLSTMVSALQLLFFFPPTGQEAQKVPLECTASTTRSTPSIVLGTARARSKLNRVLRKAELAQQKDLPAVLIL